MLKDQSDLRSPFLVPSVTQGTQTVDKIGPSLQDDVADEVHHPSLEADTKPHQRIKFIIPRNPTLVSCNINPQSIIPCIRWPSALVASGCVTPRTFKGALSSLDKDLWLVAIKKELESMNSLGVWDVIELDPSFKLVGTTWVFKVKKDYLGHITE
ncbi:hypothetical protein O181_004535 [Austropuccinia psidii MF-1]|uniref:Reverse transcriptase Ty1/copia-type domain-containing protein n=1 Tax=Austropuccinia psidii MF-1 TaxID=1389203 RepID=A0A9Q3BH56_9BASI|nr:hypothetical protein [Austropuccinia psidii MF-1]